MSNIVQFTSASNFIAASAPSFAAVPIKYFLAAYCPALDPYVTAAEDIPDLETIFPTSAVNIPEGVEVLYNLGALSSFYQLSNDKALYYTIGQSGVNTISGSDFNDVAKVNLLSGHPLSTIVSGTSFVYENGVWTVGAPDEITGINTVPSGYPNSRDKFYSDVSFSPITSGAEVRGLYKMKMGKSTGTFKYNLLIPYVTRFIDSTTEDTSIEPVMFAVLKLNYPIIKSTVDGDGNFSNTEHDLSIGFSSAISGAQNHFFLDGGYWLYNGLTNSVSWDGDVVINTSAVPGSWVPDAKLTTINTNPNKAIYKATFNDDFTKRYFYTSAATVSIDDTVYSKDRVSITKRSGEYLDPRSTIKEVLDGTNRTASFHIFNDDVVIRAGKPDTGASYLTAGVSGNSIQIISGGLNSKVIIGVTSGHDELLSDKYAGQFENDIFSVFGNSRFAGNVNLVSGTVNVSSDVNLDGITNISNAGMVTGNFLQFTGINANESSSLAEATASSLETGTLSVLTSASINNAKFTGNTTFAGSLSVGTLSVANMTGTTVFEGLIGGTIDTILLNVSHHATMSTLSVANAVNAADFNASNLITSPNANFTTLVASNLTSLTVGNGTTASKIAFGRILTAGGGGEASYVVTTPHIAANSVVVITPEIVGSEQTMSKVGTITPGVSFQIVVSNTQIGYLNWMIINP